MCSIIIMHTKTIEVVLTIVLLPSELSRVGQLLQDVTTVTTVTGLHTCLNTVSTPVFLSQHLVSQHLFWRLNDTCHLTPKRMWYTYVDFGPQRRTRPRQCASADALA